jgi:hypothetical protein
MQDKVKLELAAALRVRNYRYINVKLTIPRTNRVDVPGLIATVGINSRFEALIYLSARRK